MCNDENNMIKLAVFPVPSPPPTPPPLEAPPSYPPALPNGLQLPAPPPLPQQVGPGSGGPGLGPVPHSLPPAPSPPSPLLMPELINESGDSIVTLERGRSIDGALLAATIGGLCLCCCCCIAFCGVILYARKRFGAGNEKRWIHYKLAHSNPVWPMLYLPKDVREGLRNELYSRTVPIRRLLSRKSDPAWPAEIVMGWADITAAEEAEAAEAAEFQAEADQALAESRLITRIMRQKAANAAACGGEDGELHVDEPLPQPACVLKPQKKAPPPGRRRRSRQLPVDEKDGGSRLGASGHRRHSHQLPVFRLKVGPAEKQTGVEGEAEEALAESRLITVPTRQMTAHAAGSGGDDGELHVDEPSPQPARVLKPQQAPPPPPPQCSYPDTVENARRQWIALFVQDGNFERARALGWEGDPSLGASPDAIVAPAAACPAAEEGPRVHASGRRRRSHQLSVDEGDSGGCDGAPGRRRRSHQLPVDEGGGGDCVDAPGRRRRSHQLPVDEGDGGGCDGAPGRRRRSHQLPVDEGDGGGRVGASGRRRRSHQLAAFFEAEASKKAEVEPEAQARPRRKTHSGTEGEGEGEGRSSVGASGGRRHSQQLPVFRLKVGPAAMQTGVEGEAGEALAESRPITAPTRQLAAHAAGSGGDDGELHVDEPSPQPARVLKPQRAPPPPRGARLSGPGVLDTNIASLTKFFETEGKDKAEMEGAARPRRRNQGSEGREGEGGGTNAPFCTRRQRRSHQLPVSTAGTAALARARQSRGDSGGIPPQAAVEDDGSFTDCRTASQNGVVEASMGRERPVSAAGKAALTRARHRRGDSDNSPPPGAVDDGESSPDDYPVEFQEARPRGGADAESPTAAVRVRGEQTPRPPPPPPPYEEDPLVYDDYRI